MRSAPASSRTAALLVGSKARVDWLLNLNHGRVGRIVAETVRDGQPAREVEFTALNAGGAHCFVIPVSKLRPGTRG